MRSSRPSSRRARPARQAPTRLALLAILALLAAGCGGRTPQTLAPQAPGPSASSDRAAAEASAYVLPQPSVAPPIELTDSSGRPFSLASLRGNVVLVSFGYTH